MTKNLLKRFLWALGLLAIPSGGLFLPPNHSPAVAQSPPTPSPYILLNQEFFDAMAKLNRAGVTYGDRQEPLLQQIATASQFMVKTNLTIIQQNEKIIHLLEELNRRRLLQER